MIYGALIYDLFIWSWCLCLSPWKQPQSHLGSGVARVTGGGLEMEELRPSLPKLKTPEVTMENKEGSGFAEEETTVRSRSGGTGGAGGGDADPTGTSEGPTNHGNDPRNVLRTESDRQPSSREQEVVEVTQLRLNAPRRPRPLAVDPGN